MIKESQIGQSDSNVDRKQPAYTYGNIQISTLNIREEITLLGYGGAWARIANLTTQVQANITILRMEMSIIDIIVIYRKQPEQNIEGIVHV